ncbi:MAG: metallophosphoesterase [Myxococcales bacterium]|nr:metallophosphoesterase [Myxococcales bacterium]
MSVLRVAHFSDTHVLSLRGARPGQFLNKRWSGAVNLALARSRHYRVEIFEQLLDAVAEAEPDHTVCTGDLVNLALEPEFQRVHRLLEEVFPPQTLTLVPGNHDYYAKDAVANGLFERYFQAWQPRDVTVPGAQQYPVCRVLDGLYVVGLSTAIPTPVFMATGRVGEAQLDAMEQAFRRKEAKDRFRLLILHHPLLPEPARPMDNMRRLTDAEALIARLWKAGERGPQLVVHGHNHEFKRMQLPGTPVPIVQVASASRSGKKRRAEFNIYVIRDGALAGIERHIHEPESGRFVRCDEAGSPL